MVLWYCTTETIRQMGLTLRTGKASTRRDSPTTEGPGMLRKVEADRWQEALDVNPLYNGIIPDGGIPRFKLPDGPMNPDVAQALIRDELILDGNARLNLATFCTTWMEPQARELIAETLDRNLVDHDQYPQTADLE